ncbi:MAG TPA: hypothetical protein VMT70_03275 [Vicinamibacteria bacterium]|nr:hypothetical protein [Vicinamibacteria bacterium]
MMGPALSAAALAALLLSLPGVALLRRARPALLLAVALGVALVPLGGLPAAAYARGAVGDLSVTTMLLLLHSLLRPVLGWESVGKASRITLQVLAATGGLLLYPSALAPGPTDPYRIGFGNPWFLAALLLLATGALVLRLHFVASSIALAVLVWALGGYESRNLWDYLLDPLLAVWGTVALLVWSQKAIVQATRR